MYSREIRSQKQGFIRQKLTPLKHHAKSSVYRTNRGFLAGSNLKFFLVEKLALQTDEFFLLTSPISP